MLFEIVFTCCRRASASQINCPESLYVIVPLDDTAEDVKMRATFLILRVSVWPKIEYCMGIIPQSTFQFMSLFSCAQSSSVADKTT